MDSVRKLILDKLKERGLSMKEVSLRLGMSHSYIQQFLKRGVPAQLKEHERAILSQLLGVPESELRGTSPSLPKRDYVKLIEPVADASRLHKSVELRQNIIDNVTPPAAMFGDRDLPVFGTAQGGSGGALFMSNEAVDWVVRPAPLLRVRDGYGMIVTGDSMSPKLENGSTALVNPHLPPNNGDTCVFRRRLEDDTELAVIRTMLRSTDDTWFVSQRHPKREYSLKKSEWPNCHVIVGTYFGR